MKSIALITFDIIRPGEPQTAFAIGSILAALKNHPTYGDQFDLRHHSINLLERPGHMPQWESEIPSLDRVSHLAVSCYIWSHEQANSLMQWVKQNYPEIQIVAGGYQINSSNLEELKTLYPFADIFIPGYAEQSLIELMTGVATGPIIKTNPEWASLPSPFTTGIINLGPEVSNLRMEFKRGCPYACTFCAQHELGRPKTHYYELNRIEQELHLIAASQVRRVSVTDPVFNMGKTYHETLRTIESLSMTGMFNFQVRPELIARMNDLTFLDLLAATGSEVEIGLQTFDPEVNKIIKRGNQYDHIQTAIGMMNERNVPFGLSLIYGLPGQNLDSFKRDIDHVYALGIQEVVAYPLMLLPGTELFKLRYTENVVERPIGEYGIPHVVSGPGFTEADWEKMHELAGHLNPAGRLF